MLLGIDGGGTKTRVWLTDSDGRLLVRQVGEGSNINDIGIAQTVRRISALLEATLADYDGLNTALDSVYAGLAGCMPDANAQAMEAQLKRLLPNVKRIRVRGDVFNALYSLEGIRDGICVIAGTGSGAYSQLGKTVRRVGGWGYLIDDAGSGYDIGRRVLQSVLRAWDGRGGATALTELVKAQMDGAAPWDAISTFYKGGRAKIASFAPLAFQAAAQGDIIAGAILIQAEDSIETLIRAAAQSFPKNDGARLVVACGGLWRAPGFMHNVQQRLGDAFDLRLPQLPAVAGCVAAAADLCGCSGKAVLEALALQLNRNEGDE